LSPERRRPFRSRYRSRGTRIDYHCRGRAGTKRCLRRPFPPALTEHIKRESWEVAAARSATDPVDPRCGLLRDGRAGCASTGPPVCGPGGLLKRTAFRLTATGMAPARIGDEGSQSYSAMVGAFGWPNEQRCKQIEIPQGAVRRSTRTVARSVLISSVACHAWVPRSGHV
jgi:hypothetical protein